MMIRNAPDSVPQTPQLHRRLRWMLVVVTVAFSLMIGRLWQLQVLRGDLYYEATRENVVDSRPLPSVRGKILDRRGRPLADNRPAFNLYGVPNLLDSDALDHLAKLLDLDDEERELAAKRLRQGSKRSRSTAVLLLEDQGRERAALVKQEQLTLPGVEVRDEPYRHYPHGKLAAHLVGYMNQIRADELAERVRGDYDDSEKIGRYALERKWENYLRGRKGVERFVKNARGERIEGEEAEGLIEGPKFVPPVAGHNVVLTIDLDLQKIVEDALGNYAAGAVAVVEVDTGRVLALASTPSFDPNVMTGHLTREREAQLGSDPRKPFLDKTLRLHFPPGSTFKFVTALAGLDDGLISADELLHCPGYIQKGRSTSRCTSSHDKIDMRDAIQHSCNVYFWKLAERVGLDRIAEVARDYGFGSPTGLGLNGDVAGLIPTREFYEERSHFTIGHTLNAAVGQGDVTVSVLQLAMAYAAIANDGSLYVPQVVERVESADGDVAVQYDPILRRRTSSSPRSLQIVREGMYEVVNELGGTAYVHARSELVTFAGKTGTAQVAGRRRSRAAEKTEGWDPDRDHAWFAGFAPYEDPEIAFVVLIEHGGHGGKEAGPVARALVEGYLGGESHTASEADGGAGRIAETSR